MPLYEVIERYHPETLAKLGTPSPTKNPNLRDVGVQPHAYRAADGGKCLEGRVLKDDGQAPNLSLSYAWLAR